MSATKSLSTKICPWLLEPLEQLEQTRLAGHFAHGWLLSGPKGVGKINLALVAAHRLLSAQTGPPQELGPEEGSRAMEERHEQADHHPDLHWLFPGGSENEADPPARKRKRRTLGVDQIRDHLIEPLALTSLKGVAKVAILEIVPIDGKGLMAKVFPFYFRHITPWLGALLAGDRQAYTYLPKSVEHFHSATELERLMEQSGLQITTSLNIGLGTVAIIVGEKKAIKTTE